MACGILVPQPGIEPAPSAVKAQSPHHWTARDFPPSSFFTAFYPLHIFSTMPFIYLNASNVVILSSRPKYCRIWSPKGCFWGKLSGLPLAHVLGHLLTPLLLTVNWSFSVEVICRNLLRLRTRVRFSWESLHLLHQMPGLLPIWAHPKSPASGRSESLGSFEFIFLILLFFLPNS